MFLNRFSSAFKRYSAVVWQLVVTDLMVFRSSIVGSVIDTAIVTFLVVVAMTYVMPLLGTTQDYGPFAAWVGVPSACIFELYGFVMVLVSDIRGEKSISSRLVLPIPTYLVFVAKACAYACRVTANALVAAGVGVLVLMAGGRFSAAYFSSWKFGASTIVLLFFVGFFTLFVTSLVKDVYRLGSVWTRVLYPMWYLGGAQFAWKTTAAFSSILGYVCLFNPILYLTEGVHAATLNPEQFLNFWLCSGVTLLMTGLFGFWGIKRLKSQLQWV